MRATSNGGIFLKKLNKKYMTWSFLFCLFIPLFLPSNFLNEGFGGYAFGFPLKFVTIYQREPQSEWFFSNFFNGNAGLAINPATFALNVLIMYLIVMFILKIFSKKKPLQVNAE